jgi:hypothetical protein
MPTVKAYLDNNIVSAIAKDDLPAESEALDRLLKAMDEGKVQLVTSELTLQEIEKYQDPMQQPRVKRIFRLLQKVPIVRWDELVGMHSYGDARTWINTPMIQNNPTTPHYSRFVCRRPMPSTYSSRPSSHVALFSRATEAFSTTLLVSECGLA